MADRARRALWLIPLLLVQIGCDRATKDLAQSELLGERPQRLLGGLVKLVYVENTGAFLGLGGELGEQLRFWLFTVVIGIGLTIGLLYLLGKRQLSLFASLAGAMVVAGGLGNLIDRVVQDGRVTDFVQLGVGPLRTGIFNVADVQIMAGAAMIAWLAYKTPRQEEGPPDDAAGGPGDELAEA